MGVWLSTTKTFRIKANAKHRKTARIISVVRTANIPGNTMDVTIVTCSTNLMSENSGLNAHKILNPANARYANSQMMWGDKVNRDQFRAARTTAITASAGQIILFSGRG